MSITAAAASPSRAGVVPFQLTLKSGGEIGRRKRLKIFSKCPYLVFYVSFGAFFGIPYRPRKREFDSIGHIE